MKKLTVPFNCPSLTKEATQYGLAALEQGYLAGPGHYTRACEQLLEETYAFKKVLMTHTATSALEMIALLANIGNHDEIIMPTFTHPSTANAFVLRGAIPVLIPCEPTTMNLAIAHIEHAISTKTKAIVAVHYAGIACEMNALKALAQKHHLLLIEDAAQAIHATYRGQALGSLGHFAALSFHETKNIQCGEGGAIIINDEQFYSRMDYIYNKGTNRTDFFAGKTTQYEWVDIGSSFAMNNLSAAILFAQLQQTASICAQRLALWENYQQHIQHPRITKMSIPEYAQPNGHLFFFQIPEPEKRGEILQTLIAEGIHATAHYVPLDNAIAGKKYAHSIGDLTKTQKAANSLIRLPLWIGMESVQSQVIDIVNDVLATLL